MKRNSDITPRQHTSRWISKSNFHLMSTKKKSYWQTS